MRYAASGVGKGGAGGAGGGFSRAAPCANGAVAIALLDEPLGGIPARSGRHFYVTLAIFAEDTAESLCQSSRRNDERGKQRDRRRRHQPQPTSPAGSPRASGGSRAGACKGHRAARCRSAQDRFKEHVWEEWEVQWHEPAEPRVWWGEVVLLEIEALSPILAPRPDPAGGANGFSHCPQCRAVWFPPEPLGGICTACPGEIQVLIEEEKAAVVFDPFRPLIQCPTCDQFWPRRCDAKSGQRYMRRVENSIEWIGGCPCRIPVYVCNECLLPPAFVDYDMELPDDSSSDTDSLDDAAGDDDINLGLGRGNVVGLQVETIVSQVRWEQALDDLDPFWEDELDAGVGSRGEEAVVGDGWDLEYLGDGFREHSDPAYGW